MENVIKYSGNVDVAAPILQDILPEGMIKVYPYEMPNASKSQAFMQQQSTSIVYITQKNLGINAEGYTNEELQVDEGDTKKYFEMMAAVTSEGKLDLSSATATLGQELKEEDTFVALSNWYYEGELTDIKLGSSRFMPAVFTIGKPFSQAEYEAGDQAVYLATPMIEAKEGQAQYRDVEMNVEGLYEFNLINITAIEAQFTNAKAQFQEHFDTNSDALLTNDGLNNGITLGFENHTLISSIKGKGITEAYSAVGADEGSEFGDIDLVTKQPLAPFKMTPTDVQDKVSMYADWFDYDVVMPFVFAEKFKAVSANTGAKLSTIITNQTDLEMVEDMIVVSAGYAESWASAPILPSGNGDAGKIDPLFRVGHRALKVQTLAGKDPIQVVDGIYETFIRENPSFTTDPTRYQPVKEVLAALSRYLYTNYAIGKGQNAFNQVYLPWYLEPAKPIKFNKKLTFANPDKGAKAGDIDTYVLDDDVLFQIRTNYFTKNFSTDKISKYGTELLLPPTVNLSNVKMVQTNRKLTLPEIPYTITELNKLPLPGDINIKTSNDLMYIFYLPIQTQDILEEFYLNSLTTKTVTVKGQRYPVQIKPGNDGVIWTQAMANQEVTRIQPGTITVSPTLTKVWRTLPDKVEGETIQASANRGAWRTYKGERIKVGNGSASVWLKHFFPEYAAGITDTPIIYCDADETTQPPAYSACPVGTTTYQTYGNVRFVMSATHGNGPVYYDFTIEVAHYEFGPAEVISSGGVTDTYSFDDRQVLFDKQQWRKFLSRFNIVPNHVIDYELVEKDNFKITKLSELIIGSMWGNFVELRSQNTLIAKVDLFNATDETIGVQKILFT